MGKFKKIGGAFLVRTTRFTKDDKVDEKGLRGNIDWFIDEGACQE